MNTFRAPDIGRREVRSPLRPASTARRAARRVGWAVAATVAVASPKIAEWIGGLVNPPAVEVQRGRPGGSILRPPSPSPEFLKYWQRELPQALKTYLDIKTDADMAEKLSSFVYKLPSGEMYIWRLQDRDTVSEATGYGTKVITGFSSAVQSKEYQPIFHGLIMGYVTATQYNRNGLMPWRMEREITERGPNGEVTKARMSPRSLIDYHSALDAEFYTAWALIEADQLVKDNVWEVPAEGRDFYRTLAAGILSKLKAHCVVEMNGRHILTVSDDWGHPDVLKGAVTINPSYFNPTALRIFAEFDRSETRDEENYWLKVLKDNFDIYSEAVSFSRTMLEEMGNARTRSRHLLQNTQGNYVLDWAHRDCLRSLLGRAGFELTEFGIEPLEINGVRLSQEARDSRTRKHLQDGDPSLVQMDQGQLVVTPEMFKAILDRINGAQVVPFVPDQLEVLVEPDGKIKIRIEFGESQLSFVEKYDGIRGYRELAVYLIRFNDINDPSVPVELKVSSDMQKLLLDLMRSKQAANARVDQFRELTPLATLLLGAYGTGDEAMARDFEAEFNGYIRANTLFDPGDKNKRVPRYFGPTLALLSLTEVLEMGARTSLDIRPLEQGIAPAQRVEEELERPLPPSTNLVNAPLDFLVDYMTNFGSNPTYPITAQKMARDAQANAQRFRPTRATAHYNAGSGLRNAGKYRAAAAEFYQSLLLSRWGENPREVMMAMFNIEQILKTLNYAPAEIADIFVYLSERDGLDAQVRLVLMGGAIKQLNEAGNYNKALLLGIDFLKRYKEIKGDPSLIDQLRNYSENTDLPGRQLLVNVISQIMRAAAQQGRIADFTYQENGRELKVQMLEFESQVAEDIAAIILRGQSPQAGGELGELLRLIGELRGEVPEVFKPRIRLAEAQVQIDIMFNLYTQVKRLSLLTPGRDSLGKIDSRLGIFTPLRIKILQAGARAEQTLGEVLRSELRGERNPQSLEIALKGISAIHSFIPRIRTDLTMRQSLRYLYEPTEDQRRSPRNILSGQLAGRRPDETVSRKDSFKRERWENNNLDYEKALFINQVAQNAFRNLGLKDYMGDIPLDTGNPSLYVSFILGALALLLRAGKIKKMPRIRKKLAAGSGFAAVLALAMGFHGDAAGRKAEEVERIFSADEVAAFLEADELLAHPESALSPRAYEAFSGIRRERAELPLEMQIEMILERLGNDLSAEARDLLGTRIPGWNATIGPDTLRKILDGVGLSTEEKALFEKLTENDRAILADMLQVTRMRQAGFIDLAGLVHESASLLAQANPSADPRNVILINLILDSANFYMGWAEIPGERRNPEDLSAEAYQLYETIKAETPDLGLEERLRILLEEPTLSEADRGIIDQIIREVEDPFANERLDRLELALKACEDSTRIYISNPEHRMDLTIQAVTQMAQLTHNYLEIIRGMVAIENQKPIFSGGLPEDMDPKLRARFVEKVNLLRARFSAMLGERSDFPAELSPYLEDPIVQYLFDENTRPNLYEIFRKYPLRRANAYAFLGNTTWWGKKDIRLFIEAIGYYEQALEYDYFNIPALFGQLQLYTMDEMQKAYQTIEESLKREKDPEVLLQDIKDLVNTLGASNLSLVIVNNILQDVSLSTENKISQATAYLVELLRDVLVVDRDAVFRTYRRALQAAQRGGVNENIVAALINLSGNLWTNDPLSRDLARIAGGTASNDIKVILLLDRMRLEGF